MVAAEEAPGGGRAIGATDIEVVHGGERRELAVTETMTAMMMQGQLTVAARHTGTAALEQIGAVAGHLFEALAVRGRESVKRMLGLAQRFEQLRAQCPQWGSGLGAGTAGDRRDVATGLRTPAVPPARRPSAPVRR